MVVVTVRPRRKSNTTSNAFGVERSDSSTPVTSWIASATHQTGQWPPTGHAAVDLLAGTGTGTCSQRRVAGGDGETASPKICGWLTGSLSIAHAGRSTVVERSGGMLTETGPRAADSLSVQSASRFTTPFFSAPSRAANCVCNSADSTSRRSDCSRSCCSWDSSLARGGSILWGTCSVCQRAPAQVLRDRFHCGGLVPPPFAFGSKLAILLTKLVATLQQGPHQNPAGRLRLIGFRQDSLRSNSVGFHAQAPDLRKPHPNETEIVFRQSPERHVKGNSKST